MQTSFFQESTRPSSMCPQTKWLGLSLSILVAVAGAASPMIGADATSPKKASTSKVTKSNSKKSAHKAKIALKDNVPVDNDDATEASADQPASGSKEELQNLKKNQAVEVMKYFNPLPQEKYSLNKSQDRLIKKKSFKVTELADAQPVSNKDIGFFALIDSDKTTDLGYAEQLLQRKNVNGISVLIPWRQLQPTEDTYNWQPVDNLLSLCNKYNKTLILRVSTAGIDKDEASVTFTNTPPAKETKASIALAKADEAARTQGPDKERLLKEAEEAKAEAEKEAKKLAEKQANAKVAPVEAKPQTLKGFTDVPNFVWEQGPKAVSFKGPDDKTHLMPVFWDTTYLAAWGNFIQDLGERYNKNTNIHSIGITGGGFGGGTQVLPNYPNMSKQAKEAWEKQANEEKSVLTKTLTKEFGMNQRQLVEHWKYVIDLYLAAFTNNHLNFAINPPTPNRSGENALDEISDYTTYRYGKRVYLTRENIHSGKHGFDDWRIILKFRPDTLTAYQLTPEVESKDLERLSKFALEDGISIAEIPVSVLDNKDEVAIKALNHIESHIGYQIAAQKVAVAKEIQAGQPLPASFSFTNLGAASLKRENRMFDKAAASSYKISIEFRDSNGKPVFVSIHTPKVETQTWNSGNPIEWQQDLRTPKLAPGAYTVYMSLVDPASFDKVNFLDATSGKPKPVAEVLVGNLQIVKESKAIGGTKTSPAQ